MIGVLVIDIDDDLGNKAKIQGPVIGVENSKIAGTKMLLADPEDPDGNTIFKAIQVYEELEERDKFIAILTGDSRLGYHAYIKMNEQLDLILQKYRLDKVILVTDGVSDENDVIPILSSRNVKIIRVVRLNIKQSNRIESTYVFLINKLKDPYYSRLIFGIPGMFLFMIALAFYLNIPLSFVLTGLGILLIGYGFNVHVVVLDILKRTISNKYGQILFVSLGITLLVGLVAVAYNVYQTTIVQEDILYSTFRAIEIFIYPIMFLLIISFLLSALTSKNKVEMLETLKYFFMSVITFINTFLVLNFITGSFIYISFDDLFIYVFSLGLLLLAILEYIQNMIIAYIYSKNVVGYRVLQNISKASLGIVTGMDDEGINVQTDYKETIRLSYSNIVSIEDRVIYIRY